MPPDNVLEDGNELVVSSWDIIAGDAKPGRNVLLYDDAGDHAGMQAAETIAGAGGHVEVMTPDRSLAADVMGMNLVPYMRALQDKDVTFTLTYRLERVERSGNQLRAHIGSDYMPLEETREFDQIVVNHGTIPLDDIYFALKPRSANHGAVDYEALVAGRPQPVNGADGFQLYRIGDAVSSRSTHAAIYDALRLVKDI
jgi:hypothetical protein